MLLNLSMLGFVLHLVRSGRLRAKYALLRKQVPDREQRDRAESPESDQRAEA